MEVKGTQNTGHEILLTPGEVRLARKAAPHTALFVLHSVIVTESGGKTLASGGIPRIIKPWNPTKAMLKPSACFCKLPPQ